MMRKLLFLALLLAAFLVPKYSFAQGNVGIGTTAPDASALLELFSTTRGLLIPRMTEAQKWLISTPATGLLIYETDAATLAPYAGTAATFWYYNGTTWLPIIASSAGWSLTGNSGTTAGTNFIGTTDAQDWVIKTNNTERARFYSTGNLALVNSNNTAEELRFLEPSGSGTNYTSFKAGIQAATVSYRLPLADGTSGQQLTTDGSGNLSWATACSTSSADTLWARGTGTLALYSLGSGNAASGDYSTAAGRNSLASGDYSIAFGHNDTASTDAATVSGGELNSANGLHSSITGGYDNKINVGSDHSSITGGSDNTTNGTYDIIPGGRANTVSGHYSLAFGWGANVTQDFTVVFNHPNAPSPSQTLVGIRTNTPTEALDVEGNIRFANALMPNNLAGTSGQVLTSQGAGTAPIWTSIGSSATWSLTGNSGTLPASNFIGTTDNTSWVIRTNNIERVRVLNTGQVGIGTSTPVHQLHSVNSATTDEYAAVYGVASGNGAGVQNIGVWGDASGTGTNNTGSVGVMATGNGNTTAGQTNMAVEFADGELGVGRTTQSPSVGTSVEPATSGTTYTAQGPSGVIELTLGGGNLVTTAPVAGAQQNLGPVTINNRYVSTSSIILACVESKVNGFSGPNATDAVYRVDVESRASGSFVIRIGMIPTVSNASNYSTSNKIRIGYIVINPSR